MSVHVVYTDYGNLSISIYLYPLIPFLHYPVLRVLILGLKEFKEFCSELNEENVKDLFT